MKILIKGKLSKRIIKICREYSKNDKYIWIDLWKRNHLNKNYLRKY